MEEVVSPALPHPQVVHPLLEVVDGLLLLLEASQLGGDGGALGDDDPHQFLDGVATLGSLVQESSDTKRVLYVIKDAWTYVCTSVVCPCLIFVLYYILTLDAQCPVSSPSCSASS